MASITQDLKFKQAVIQYSLKHGVTAAAKRYKRTRQWIYYWQKRYDGDIHSLSEMSRRPHSHPNAHTQDELKLIADMRRRNGREGLVVFWIKAATARLYAGSFFLIQSNAKRRLL